MAWTVSQIAEALGTSVCCLLAKRMYHVDGSAFEQAMATSEDMGQVGAWFAFASVLMEGATKSELDRTWRNAFAIMQGEAADKGFKLLETSTEAAVSKAAKGIAKAYEPLHEAKDVYLVTYSGEYQDITTTWRQMQGQAAAAKNTTADDWMQSYTSTLARKGVGISIGDSGVREISGAVRSYAMEAKFAYADDINRAAALSVGMDAAQISAHAHCAPDHLPYQGRVYTLTELDHINETIARPIGRGVMNCRHSLLYCYSDSTSTYTGAELAEFEQESNRSVSYTGRSGKTLTSTRYEATQYMRSSELGIRKLKQQRYIKSAAGLDTSSLDTAIDTATDKYKTLCEELGETYTASRITAYTMADL